MKAFEQAAQANELQAKSANQQNVLLKAKLSETVKQLELAREVIQRVEAVESERSQLASHSDSLGKKVPSE